MLREGLRLVEAREGFRSAELKAFDSAIAEGEAALAAGDFITVSSDEDLDAFMRSLRSE